MSRNKIVNKIIDNSNESIIKSAIALKSIQGNNLEDSIKSIKILTYEDMQEMLKDSSHGELYFRWLLDDTLKINHIIKSIDLERVLQYEKAKKNTDILYQDKLNEIIKILHQDTSGVYSCINEIYEDNIASNDTLDMIYEIKKQLEFIEDSIKKLQSTIRSLLSNTKITIFLFVIILLITPILYYTSIDTTNTSSIQENIINKINIDKKIVADVATKSGTFEAIKFFFNNIIVQAPLFINLVLFIIFILQKIFINDKYKMKKLEKYKNTFTELSKHIKTLKS